MKHLKINNDIPGWKELEALVEMAKIVQTLPQNAKIVEIGCGVGRLTWVLSKNCPCGTVYAIDKWSGRVFNPKNGPDEPYSYHDLLLTEDNFNIYTKDCDNIIPIHAKSPFFNWDFGNVDLAFIDVNDEYESVKDNIIFWQDKMNPKGILGGDDYESLSVKGFEDRWSDKIQHSETRNAVDDMAKMFNYKII